MGVSNVEASTAVTADGIVARDELPVIDREDFRLLSAAMELENGMNSCRCIYLTGAVILNRVNYCSWAPNTINGVLHQKGQYASYTVNNLDKVQPSNRVMAIARKLLLEGCDDVPKDLIYQAMFKQGRLYEKVDTEYFGREE